MFGTPRSDKLPYITVITVCFNAAAFFRYTISSLKRQLYPARHIVIDLGSSDETIEIARRGLSVHDTVLSEPDKNPYDALNKGIGMATGDIVAILDPSSYYAHSRVLWIIANILSDENTDACYGDTVWIDQGNQYKVKRYGKSRPANKMLDIEGSLPPYPAMFIKRRVYEELGGFQSEQGPAAEYEFLRRLFLRYRMRAVYIPQVLIAKKCPRLSHLPVDKPGQDTFLYENSRYKAERKRARWKRIIKSFTLGLPNAQRNLAFKPWLDSDWPIPSATGESIPAIDDAVSPSHEQKESIVGSSTKSSSYVPRLYVVTVNYQSEEAIARLVRSLEQCSIVHKLVIIDHSPVHTLQLHETSFPIEVIRQPNRGYGAGINRGLRTIDELDAIALICNPDIEIMTPHAVAEAIKELKDHPHLGCLIPAQVDGRSNTIAVCRRFYTWKSLIQSRIGFMRKNPHVYRRRHFYLDRDLTQSFDVDWGNASSMFLKLSLFPYPVCLDERFFLYFEDVDICAQMHVHGYSVRYYPRVVIRHYEQRQSHRDLFFFVTHIKSLWRFVVKYRGLPQAVDFPGSKGQSLDKGHP